MDLAPEPDWFGIYKSLEALKLYHGSEQDLGRAFPHLAGEIDLARRTANSYRHTRGKFQPVKNPMRVGDGAVLIRRLLAKRHCETGRHPQLTKRAISKFWTVRGRQTSRSV